MKKHSLLLLHTEKVQWKSADVLYGVTMQESGVSKLVSVRLDEGEELVASRIERIGSMSFFKKLKEKISKQTDTVTEKFKHGLEKTRNSFAEK